MYTHTYMYIHTYTLMYTPILPHTTYVGVRPILCPGYITHTITIANGVHRDTTNGCTGVSHTPTQPSIVLCTQWGCLFTKIGGGFVQFVVLTML